MDTTRDRLARHLDRIRACEGLERKQDHLYHKALRTVPAEARVLFSEIEQIDEEIEALWER